METMSLWWRRIWQSVLLFFFIYSFHLSYFGIPDEIHTGRIAVILSVILAVVSGNKKNLNKRTTGWKSFKSIINVHVFLLFYSVILIMLWGMGTGQHVITFIVNMFLFCFVPIYTFVLIFDSVDDFAHAILGATIIQSLFVAGSLIDPSFRAAIDLIFNNFARNESLRESYAGGLACISAPGAIKFSMGLMACFYFILKQGKLKYYFLYFYLSLLCAMIARTGLILSLVGILLLFIFNILVVKNVGRSIKTLLAIFALFYISILIISSSQLNVLTSGAIDVYLNKFVALENGGTANWMDKYFDGTTTVIPPISFETIIGTGMIDGISGNGIKINADGGFFRLYAAYGLLIAIFFYLFLLIQLLRCAHNTKQKYIMYTLLLLTSYIIIGEFKEFVVYGIYILVIFYVLAILGQKCDIDRGAVSRGK